MESNNTEKTFNEKTLVEKFTTSEGKFNLAGALSYLEARDKDKETRLLALEEAMAFFSDWFNKTQRANIILPENLDENGATKIITNG